MYFTPSTKSLNTNYTIKNTPHTHTCAHTHTHSHTQFWWTVKNTVNTRLNRRSMILLGSVHEQGETFRSVCPSTNKHTLHLNIGHFLSHRQCEVRKNVHELSYRGKQEDEWLGYSAVIKQVVHVLLQMDSVSFFHRNHPSHLSRLFCLFRM